MNHLDWNGLDYFRVTINTSFPSIAYRSLLNVYNSLASNSYKFGSENFQARNLYYYTRNNCNLLNSVLAVATDWEKRSDLLRLKEMKPYVMSTGVHSVMFDPSIVHVSHQNTFWFVVI